VSHPAFPAPTHRLRTLGGLLLEGPDGPASGALTQRRRLALLSLLAASDGGISRDRVIGLLWPESEEDKARHALAQLIHSLRRDLGDGAIVGSATMLRLNGSIVSSDIADFSAALERGDLERAVDLYRGPFLDGFYLNGCPDFERWTDERRDTLAHDAERAVETLARNATDASIAVTWWRRLAAMRRLDSRVALELMRAMARAGDRAGAMEHASAHEELLRSELDHAPPPELTAFAESLRAASSPAAPKRAVPASRSPVVEGAVAPVYEQHRRRSQHLRRRLSKELSRRCMSNTAGGAPAWSR
jgi:DNA-binding SARP family transcriptional activator